MKLLYTNRIIEYKHEIIEIGKFTTNNKIIRFIH